MTENLETLLVILTIFSLVAFSVCLILILISSWF
jgi:hypothetical protein